MFHQQINNEYVQWLKQSGMINRCIAFTVENEIHPGKILHWGIEKFFADDGDYWDSLRNKPTIGFPWPELYTLEDGGKQRIRVKRT